MRVALALFLLAVGTSIAAPLPAGEWVNRGPQGGYVLDIAVDPSSQTTVYAAARAGGVFRSDDAGRRWRPVTSGLRPAWIRTVVVDPSNPRRLYATSTGPSSGLYRSRNGGERWRQMRLGPVSAVAVHPQDSSVVYLASVANGLLKSTDGAESFDRIGPESGLGYVYAIAIHPQRPETLLMATSRGLLKSGDGGESLEETGQEVAFAGTPLDVLVDPVEPEIVFGRLQSGLARSEDGGESWQLVGLPPVRDLAFAPTADAAVYALARSPGVEAVFRSTDRGRSWQPLAGRLPEEAVWSIGITGTGRLLIASACGVYRSPDGGSSWRPSSRGLQAHDVTSLAADPLRPGVLYAGTRSCGRFKTRNSGRRWGHLTPAERSQPWRSEETHSLEIDPNDRRTLYATTFGGVYRSRSAGRRWRRLKTERAGVFEVASDSSVVVDAADSDRIYAAYDTLLYVSTNGGADWALANLGSSAARIWDLEVDPSGTGAVFLTTTTRGVLRSTDGGASWRSLNFGLPSLSVKSIAIHPQEPSILYAAPVGHGPYKSVNGGRSWSRGALPSEAVEVLLVDPADPREIYLGSRTGVFRSRNAGRSWARLGHPRTHAFVTDLELSGDDIWAATFDGAWLFEPTLRNSAPD